MGNAPAGKSSVTRVQPKKNEHINNDIPFSNSSLKAKGKKRQVPVLVKFRSSREKISGECVCFCLCVNDSK